LKRSTVSVTSKPAQQLATRRRRDQRLSVDPVGRHALLDAARRQFAKAGYDGTTLRDIAAVCGMVAGSIYYYFDSKETLFLAVHEHAIDHICASVLRSMAEVTDPWTRLRCAAQGYLESMLHEPEYASIIVSESPFTHANGLRKGLLAHRRRFEALFADLVAALPLREGVDRRYVRLTILGMLAWSYIWYSSSGKDSPRTIAEKLVHLLKDATVAPHRAKA
jgi:AcrR family transcriptional regulator